MTGVKVVSLMDIIGAFKMRFKVKYAKISWTTSGKRTTHEDVVKAENRSEAVKKVLIKTKGSAYNIRVEEIKEVEDGEGK